VHYLAQPCADYVIAAVEAVMEVHKQDLPGDVLVFLTGQQVRGEQRCSVKM
jgi:ATP-dependent RNA helicase DDX35